MDSNRQLIDRALHTIDLPPVMQKVCDVIGWDAALKLINHAGGTVLDLPRRAMTENGNTTCPALCALLGMADYEKLIVEFGGQRLYVAKCDGALRTSRNAEINRRYMAGESASKLALAYKLTERQIWFVLKNPVTLRTQQPDLFSH